MIIPVRNTVTRFVVLTIVWLAAHNYLKLRQSWASDWMNVCHCDQITATPSTRPTTVQPSTAEKLIRTERPLFSGVVRALAFTKEQYKVAEGIYGKVCIRNVFDCYLFQLGFKRDPRTGQLSQYMLSTWQLSFRCSQFYAIALFHLINFVRG